VALVVLLRGVNVGGHRTFRPKELAAQLTHLDAVNIGAAGTFVIRKKVSPAKVRAELVSRLPFETEIMICEARELAGLMSHPFANQPVRPGVTRFVSVLAKGSLPTVSLPICLPSADKWLLKIFARENQFVLGMYRRHMKVIGYLGKIDQLLGAPATTRNWNTIAAIAKVLG
jgi:uncharacterized protein (DUF1697 family)